MLAAVSRLRDRVASQRNVTIYAAILSGGPLAYAFGVAFEPDASFLLVVAVAVVVPTAYDEYWPPYDRTRTAVAWILVAAALTTAAFAGLYLLGTRVLSASPLLAGGAAFLLTSGAIHALLASRRDG